MSTGREHERWINWHLSRRHGERKDALKRGHGFGNQLFIEKVWWPLVGHLEDLHPEYEVLDWRGRSYFVDFMWVLGSLRFAIEIMDYGSHGKDRTKYRMDLNRGLYLQSQQCHVISISFDEMKENPVFIQAMLRHMLGPYLASGQPMLRSFNKIEHLLIRYAASHNRIIRPAAAAPELDLHKQTVIKYCQRLVSEGMLRPVPTGSTGKVYSYELLGSIFGLELMG